MQTAHESLPHTFRVLRRGIARHTVAILGAASVASLVGAYAASGWARVLVFSFVAGAVANGRRWHPAHVTRVPWWASALAGACALVVAGGSLMLARKLGLASATIGSFRLLTFAVVGGLVYAVLNLGDLLLSDSVDRMESEGDEVRARFTLPRPKRSINSRR